MDILEQFLVFLHAQKNQPSRLTIKNYKADVRQFIVWFESYFKKNIDPSAVTHQIIEIYKQQKSLSPRSLERHMSSLRKFFHFLKTEGITLSSPFEQQLSNETIKQSDPWKLKTFKDYLYVYNSSPLTIKNYIIDIKQFLSWAEKVIFTEQAPNSNQKNIFNHIDEALIEEYKQRLLHEARFSPSSINRKLSALRRYFGWAMEEGLLATKKSAFADSLTGIRTDVMIPDPSPNILAKNKSFINSQYSKFPPLRVAQKVSKAIGLVFDHLVTNPLAKNIEEARYLLWKAKGKPVFTRISNFKSQISNLKLRKNDPLGIGNYRKAMYAPLAVSTKYFPWYKKLWHHLRHTRPQWYRKYHSYTVTHYFHFAILVIFTSAVGVMLYQSLTSSQEKQFVLAASDEPLKILSFQGKLTDSSNNPISAAETKLRFIMYNDPNASGSAKLWEEVRSVTTDRDGVFSTLLGSRHNDYAPLCENGNPPTDACGIPQSLFQKNSALYIGVAIEDGKELTPRQQLPTVSYAQSADVLQGLLPITDTRVTGNTNAILALNSSGTVAIGGSLATTFQATNGTFALSGQTLLLQTNPGSSGDIKLLPDGSGNIDIQGQIKNDSDSGVVPGAVTVSDKFVVSATESASAAFIINNDSEGGDLLTASSSGSTRFTITNTGDMRLSSINPVISAAATNATLELNANGIGTLTFQNGAKGDIQFFSAQNTISSKGNLTLAGVLAVNGGSITTDEDLTINPSGGDIILPNSVTLNIGGSLNDVAYNVIGDSTTAADSSLDSDDDLLIEGNLQVAGNLIAPLTGISGYWQRQNNTLSLVNTVDSIGIGTTAPSATLDIQGNLANSPAASIAAKSTVSALVVDNTGTGDIIAASVSGVNKFVVKNDGTVVVGGGSGKITVGTIDPLYNINGEKFATYVSSMPGLKEEVTGKALLSYDAKLKSYAHVLDFNAFEKGSDNWIFAQITDPNIDYTTVLLTANSQATTWYQKDTQNRRIVLYADRPVELSYRLTSPRYDHEYWKNAPHDESDGIPINPPPPLAAIAEPKPYDSLATLKDYTLLGYKLVDNLGNVIEKGEAYSHLLVANLRVGLIDAQKITTNSISSTNITISGQHLKDYIVSVVAERWHLGQGATLISPIAEIDVVRTNIISPLASDTVVVDGKLVLRHPEQVSGSNEIPNQVRNDTLLEIQNASGSAVASIDSSGNATFSGTLAASEVQSSKLKVQSLDGEDATISGTLRADRIVANSIEGLDAQVATIAATYIQNTQNTDATDSSDTLALPSFPSIPNLVTDYVDISSLSGQLAYVDSFSASFGRIANGLMVLGPSSFSDVSVTGQLAVGGSLILADNSINVLGSDLELQPLRQGGVSLLSGLVHIDADGNLKVGGNAEFEKDVNVKGVLSANIIVPIPNQDLVVKLGNYESRIMNQENSSTSDLTHNSSFLIHNSSDSAVLSIDQNGNLNASGSGSFANFVSKEFRVIREAQADTSMTETIASSSAGTATIITGETERTIITPYVTETSLIYFTPTTDTGGLVPHLARQTVENPAIGSKGSFTIAIPNRHNKDITLNWWIVN